ncbi:MAG TPA: type II toxin-antitoxin system VapC family toxin [Acidimicrobiales bacterium]|nr:type II toxin-antitoxin system VapC family toxin [Acidimicrobiales bacterium]
MLGTLVDSNVLLDVITEDESWLEWSANALASAADDGPLFINPIIYAEVSVRFSFIEDVEEALPPPDYGRLAVPWESAFLAGKAFLDYRRNKGSRSSTLPDFFIGAHAAVADLALLTRDAARYRTYFPTVQLRSPE